MKEITLKNNTGRSYLTGDEVGKIIDSAKVLRKGQKFNKLGIHRLRVLVDGEWFGFNRYFDLRNLLEACLVNRADFRMFRNADKGVSIILDKNDA